MPSKGREIIASRYYRFFSRECRVRKIAPLFGAAARRHQRDYHPAFIAKILSHVGDAGRKKYDRKYMTMRKERGKRDVNAVRRCATREFALERSILTRVLYVREIKHNLPFLLKFSIEEK